MKTNEDICLMNSYAKSTAVSFRIMDLTNNKWGLSLPNNLGPT